MEKLKRKVFFWVLVALFLITAPTVVLRARGYRFDSSRGVFVHSGSITLKTNPQNIEASLNQKPVESKVLSRINSSYTLTGLIPKNYDVQLSYPEFQSWTKKAEVHSGVSSEFWNILLVRNNYERTQYDSLGIDRFFISPKNKYVVFSQNSDSGIAVKILNIKANLLENDFTFPEWKLLDVSKKENMEWAPEEEYISVPVQKISITAKKDAGEKILNGTEEKVDYAYFILDPVNDSSFNLNEFWGRPAINHVRWDPQNTGFLFFLDGSSLYRANIEDKNDLTLIAEDVSSYELSRSGVYFTQNPGQFVYETSFDGKSDKNQLTFAFPQSSATANKSLIVYDNFRMAFLSSNKEFFVYNAGEHDSYFRKLGDSVEGMQFSDDGKKLLYWTRNELFVYFLRDWNVQPLRSENEIQNITRYSEEIRNVQWFGDYEHVIFSVNGQFKIIELDARDHRNIMDLVKTGLNKTIATYDNSLEKFFFIDQLDNSTSLYSFNFPEKTGILGL